MPGLEVIRCAQRVSRTPVLKGFGVGSLPSVGGAWLGFWTDLRRTGYPCHKEGLQFVALPLPLVAQEAAVHQSRSLVITGIIVLLSVCTACASNILHTLSAHRSTVRAVTFSPDGQTLASASSDNTIRLWNVVDGAELAILSGNLGDVTSVQFSPDGLTLVAGLHCRVAKMWDVPLRSEFRTLTGHINSITSVAYSPDGLVIATGSSDGTLRLWDSFTGREIQSLVEHTGTVYSVTFLPDGATLISGGYDGTIRLWDCVSGTARLTIETGSGAILAVAASPDGRIIAAGSDRDEVSLWLAETGEHVFTMTGHQSDVYSVAVSPRGDVVASGSGDSTVKLWSTTTGRILGTLEGHSSSVKSVDFSPDSTILASGSADESVILWDVGPLVLGSANLERTQAVANPPRDLPDPANATSAELAIAYVLAQQLAPSEVTVLSDYVDAMQESLSAGSGRLRRLFFVAGVALAPVGLVPGVVVAAAGAAIGEIYDLGLAELERIDERLESGDMEDLEGITCLITPVWTCGTDLINQITTELSHCPGNYSIGLLASMSGLFTLPTELLLDSLDSLTDITAGVVRSLGGFDTIFIPTEEFEWLQTASEEFEIRVDGNIESISAVLGC